MSTEIDVPPPYVPVLSEAGRRLLSAIDTLMSREGSVPATRRLRNVVIQAVRRHPENVPGQWTVEATGLHDELRRAYDNGAAAFGALSAQSGASATYKAFATATSSTLSPLDAASIDAALGLIVVTEASLGQSVSPSVMAAYQTFHMTGTPRQGRQAAWKAFVEDFPRDLEAANAALAVATDPGLKSFLAGYARALGAKIPSPESLFAPGQRPTGGTANVLAPDPDGKRTQGMGVAAEGEDDDASPASLIGWLRERAARAGYLARFGVEGRWDLQTKAETTVICAAVHAALAPAHPSRPFAFLAVMSLCSAMPARRAVEIKIQRNSDIWLELKVGALRWYLVRLLDGDRAKATPSDAALDEAYVIDIWLPAAAVAAGLEFASARPNAETVFELLFGAVSAEERQAILTKYRAWLHSIGYRSLHGVEDARLSRSLGQFYREQCGDVVAALAGLDLDEVALGMLHYVGLTRSFLHQQNDGVYRRIGLGPAVPLGLPDATLGSQVALTGEQFFHGLSLASSSADGALRSMLAATTAADLIRAWTELVEWRLLATVELTAGRGDRLERLTWAAVLGHRRYLLHADKDIDEYTKVRLVPICRALRAILDAHARDLRRFCAKAAGLGIEVTSPRGRRFDDRSPHRVCFYGARLVEHAGKHYLRRTAIDRSVLVERCRSVLDRPLNVGRHTLITLCVRNGVEPALVKTLSGHVNGHAEPYSDGQWIRPIDGLALLSAALEWILAPLVPAEPDRCGVLTLSEWRFRPPFLRGGPVAGDCGVRVGSNATAPSDAQADLPVERQRWVSAQGRRVLAEPFDATSIAALRIVDHLRAVLLAGLGPSDRGANLLLNLMLVTWVALADVKRLWTLPGPFVTIGRKSSAAVWQRESCRAEIRRPLVGPTNIALHQVEPDQLGDWDACCGHARDWLSFHVPATSWSADGRRALEALEALLERWLRLNVPAFLLTAASPRIAAPTATRGSILRLMADPDPELDATEQLVYPAPQARGSGRVRMRQDALAVVVSKIADYCDEESDNAEGENWQRAKNLARDLSAVDVTDHLPAVTLVEWNAEECRRWEKTEGDRIKVSSLNTYTGHVKPAFVAVSRDEDMRHWYEEWFSFVAYLRDTVPPGTREQMQERRHNRETAARRLMSTLASLGYSIPPELLAPGARQGHDGMRKSAAAVWILKADQRRVTELMARHHAQLPLERVLAPLYSELRWKISFRSMEAAVAGLDAIDQFDQFVITTDGFAHLKSDHARRMHEASPALVGEFRAAATAVVSAVPKARWMFLLNDRHDWSTVHDFEEAFSAALKQVCRESDARPHASRSVAPVDALVPGWEDLLRRFILGEVSTAECAAFCESLRRAGFGHVIRTMLRTAHGHPVTYIRYYFAIWDVLLSVFAQGSLFDYSSPESLGKACTKSVAAAYRKALSRAKAANFSFDAWQWMTTYMPSSSKLPPLTAELQPRLRAEGRPTTRVAPKTSEAVRARYIALRITGLDEISTAHALELSTAASAALETILCGRDLSAARKRHQAGDSVRGKNAEIKYLREETGTELAEHLARCPPALVKALSDALQPRRSPGYRLPDIETLRSDLLRLATCLPASLALLVQFHLGQLSSADRARLQNEKGRVFVGDPDRDLGSRPRVSVIETACPLNPVGRARRTANVRCVIAALDLVRSFPGSNNT